MSRRRNLLRAAALCAAVISPAAVAQDAMTAPAPEAPVTADVADLSLEDLLNAQVGVATRTAVATRESPGILSIVSREEIANSGARDLLDILRLVPGFDFGVDVEQAVGVGFRGNWGHEGKILLLIDGQEFNENLYSTLQLGHHFLADTIERVEVIRGPGSAIYGGYAELAVINVITRSADGLQGGAVTLRAGSGGGFLDRDAILTAAKSFLDGDLKVSLNAYAGQANRSDRLYKDFSGNEVTMNGNSRTDPAMVNLGIAFKGFRGRLIYDNYRISAIDGFGEVIDPAPALAFQSLHADAQYDLKLGAVTITPRLNYKSQTPWKSLDDSDLFYDKTSARLLGSVIASLDPVEGLNVLVGVEGYQDRAKLNNTELKGSQTQFGDQDQIAYTNFAGFAQALWRNPYVNVTAGARFENHSAVGSAFVPRVGLTKVIDRIHFKLLYSGAFRSPGIENINLGTEVKQEQTWVAEGEIGYQFTDNVFARVNVFDININRPIIYAYDEATDSESYKNFPQTGTRGWELELRTRFESWSAVATYSYYEARNNEVPSYAVNGFPDTLLGLARHKVTLNGTYNLTRSLAITPSGTFLGGRYGFIRGLGDGTGVQLNYGDTLLVNLFLDYKDLGVKGLDVGVGAYNLLNVQNAFLQPYDGGHAPLPAEGIKVLARVGYTLPL